MKVLWNARILYNAKPKDTYEFENGKWKMENGWIGELLCCVLLVLVCWCVGVLVCWLGNKHFDKQDYHPTKKIKSTIDHR